MLDRRSFIAGAAALAAPVVLPRGLRAQTVRVRQDVQAMLPTATWFADYAQAVAAMHALQTTNPTSPLTWRNQALTHIRFCPHRRPDFFAWHRLYIRRFEAICGQLIGKPDFALAYWNWSANRGRIPDRFYTDARLNPARLNDPSNASAPNWRNGQRVQTRGPRALPRGRGLADTNGASAFRPQAIEALMRFGFTDLQSQLEGSPHSVAHTRVGGHMTSGMSPLDPIFWLHHANVDRIWAEWQARGNVSTVGTAVYTNQFADVSGSPVSDREQSAPDHLALGFTYQTLVGLPPAPAAAAAGPASMAAFTTAQGLAPATAQRRRLAQREGRVRVPELRATSISVPTEDLAAELFEPRVFRAPAAAPESFAIESRRILARLGGVTSNDRTQDLVVRVFVNAPDAGPYTPDDDPRFAGVFSLFGVPGAPHGGHGGATGHDFVIDITEPLRRQAGSGRAADEVTVQLVPVPDYYRRRRQGAAIEVGSLEIVSV
jgi:tyrosinase